VSGILERTLAILEYLAANAEGASLAAIAEAATMPRSAAHRLLTDLCAAGYVAQSQRHGDYALTTKLVSLGLGFLSSSGIVDIAQPILDRLAEDSGELVRLSVVDGERLTWVARAQGARRGLRYDPDMGMVARFSCTATGHALLLTLSDEAALELVARQGFGQPQDYGPKAPTTVPELLKYVVEARARGYSIIDEVFTPGMTAMAAPVMGAQGNALGVISIAGPRVRLDMARMLALGPALLDAAAELGASSRASTHFRARPLQGRA
jgi:DNA-binding IclR family transcriptional regulator